MKGDMAEKMNEAAEIYQKGLEMMKQKGESPKTSPKDTESLEKYMVSTIVAPIKAAVLVVLHRSSLDP